MRLFFFLVCSLSLLSCKVNQNSFDIENYLNQQMKENKTELDLSSKDLKKIPDLKKFSITKLNLSHNKIKKLDYRKLPSSLEFIDLSYNQLKDSIILSQPSFPLIKMDLSNNKITFLLVKFCLKNLDVSRNNLSYLGFYCGGEKTLDSLNISHNKLFSNIIPFEPNMFKNINKKNINNTDSLKYSFNQPIKN